MRRVENKQSHYQMKQCDRDRQKHLRYLLNMTRFPEAYKEALEKEVDSKTHTAFSNIPFPTTEAEFERDAGNVLDAISALKVAKGVLEGEGGAGDVKGSSGPPQPSRAEKQKPTAPKVENQIESKAKDESAAKVSTPDLNATQELNGGKKQNNAYDYNLDDFDAS